jgi:hypothetical protein
MLMFTIHLVIACWVHHLCCCCTPCHMSLLHAAACRCNLLHTVANTATAAYVPNVAKTVVSTAAFCWLLPVTWLLVYNLPPLLPLPPLPPPLLLPMFPPLLQLLFPLPLFVDYCLSFDCYFMICHRCHHCRHHNHCFHCRLFFFGSLLIVACVLYIKFIKNCTLKKSWPQYDDIFLRGRVGAEHVFACAIVFHTSSWSTRRYLLGNTDNGNSAVVAAHIHWCICAGGQGGDDGRGGLW